MDAEFWQLLEKVIPVIMGLILAFVAYMGKKAMADAKQAKDNTAEVKELVVENTALTQQIKTDVEVVKATTSGEQPAYVPQKRP